MVGIPVASSPMHARSLLPNSLAVLPDCARTIVVINARTNGRQIHESCDNDGNSGLPTTMLKRHRQNRALAWLGCRVCLLWIANAEECRLQGAGASGPSHHRAMCK